jgi:hypothetical protein
MRALIVILVAAMAAILVYSVPLAIEVEMLRWNLNPWILRMVCADIPACGFLFVLGLRWSAVFLYAAIAAVAGFALGLGLGPEVRLAMALNLAPAVVAATASMRIALRYTVAGEENL